MPPTASVVACLRGVPIHIRDGFDARPPLGKMKGLCLGRAPGVRSGRPGRPQTYPFLKTPLYQAMTVNPIALPQLAVVVPVHNEAGNIAPLIGEISRSLDGRYDYEIVYVDDGSSDSTAAELGQAGVRFPAVRVITHRRRSGQSAASGPASRRREPPSSRPWTGTARTIRRTSRDSSANSTRPGTRPCSW